MSSNELLVPAAQPSKEKSGSDDTWISARVVQKILGFLLVFAAIMKLTGGPSSVVSSITVYSHSAFVALIQAEMILGVWLIGGWFPRACHLVAIIFFIILATISGWMVAQGQSECECFGRLEVRPETTLLVDIAAVGLLVATWRVLWLSTTGHENRATELLRGVLVATIAGIAIVILLVLSLQIFWQTNLQGVLARLRGESWNAKPSSVFLGSAESGIPITSSITLENFSDRDLRIVGSSSSCSCLLRREIPFTIARNSSETIDLTVQFRGSSGRFVEQIIYYSDAADQITFAVRIHGRIRSGKIDTFAKYSARVGL